MIRKYYFILVVFIVLISVIFALYVMFTISNTKQQYILEVKEYLDKKYSLEMNIKGKVSLGDMKSVQAYPVEIPEIVFFVQKTNEIRDTFLRECLKTEASDILIGAFSEYDAEIYVSELMYVNPTPDGKNASFFYLDNLYYELGRIPVWKDINEYQKIKLAEVNISTEIDEDNLLGIIQKVQNSGCHIESLQITDIAGKIYEYSI